MNFRLKQYEETYKIISNSKILNISECNYYSKKIAKLKNMINLKSEPNNKIIIIEKKSIKHKVDEERIKDYYMNNIETHKELINNINTCES